MGAVKTAERASGGTATAAPKGNGKGTHRRGLKVSRRWTRAIVHPFDEIDWELRTASIGNEKGEVVFEQKDVEVPSFWTQLATNVVVSKYFRGAIGTPQREHSVKQLIGRVANTISDWGVRDGYFATTKDGEDERDRRTPGPTQQLADQHEQDGQNGEQKSGLEYIHLDGVSLGGCRADGLQAPLL